MSSMSKPTVILGAGFGGIAVALELRRLVGPGHGIVLVDRREKFSMGLRKLWELVGIGTIADGSRPREALRRAGIDVRQQTVEAIDPAARQVTVAGQTLEAGHLVVALGAEARPDLVPGLTEHGHDVWTPAGVPRAAEALRAFTGGRILVAIFGMPYPCPPAPFECAMLLDEHLRSRGLRERTEIVVSTPAPILLPNAGKDGSAWLGQELAKRGIVAHTGKKPVRVEAGRVIVDGGELAADLIFAVPPHKVPAVVKASGLVGDGDWITVDRGTLATAFPGVFAIGDVTGIKLGNGLLLPKAGLVAELQGKRVAAAIAAELQGQAAPPAFDGNAACFLEMGKDVAAQIQGDFYAMPEPRMTLRPPSAEAAADKRAFERDRLAAWFGA